jgi:Flp pilus assembly protein TadD
VIYARSVAALGQPGTSRLLLDKLAKQPNQAGRAAAERARIERQARGPEAAIQSIESAGLDLADPANALALRELVQLQLDSGQAKRALALTARLAQEHPAEASLCALHGHVLLHGGAGAEARQEFERALELDAAEATALVGLGQLAQRSGDRAAAVDLFERAARARPDEPTYGYAAAQALLLAGRTAEAERRLRELVHRFPELGPAANDLAWLLAERGESLDFALALAQRAVSLARGPEVLDTQGWVQFRRGELEASAESLRAALELAPDYATARYHLGLCLAKAGDAAGAREAFRTALASGSFPEAQEARTELANLEGGQPEAK